MARLAALVYVVCAVAFLTAAWTSVQERTPTGLFAALCFIGYSLAGLGLALGTLL